MVALVWLVAGLLLTAAEALTGDLFLLMLGGAALVTAGVSYTLGAAVWVDAVVFAVVAIGLLFAVRPMLLRRFAVPAPTPTNTAALTGKAALVLEAVDAQHGQVKIGGEVWTARPLDEHEVYAVGDKVTVMKIDGATAVVWKGL